MILLIISMLSNYLNYRTALQRIQIKFFNWLYIVVPY